VTGISANKIKWIRSLQQKKFRDEYGLFVIEGEKMVREVIEAHADLIEVIYSLEGILEEQDFIQLVSPNELERISSLSTPNKALAVLRKPVIAPQQEKGLTVVLDTIQDPGNLGTIIRIADWFGVKEIVCSNETADCFSSKVVQSAMGSVLRIKVSYTDLTDWFNKNENPVYGALMQGNSSYETNFSKDAVLVIGNEGKGISEQLQQFISHPVTIPRFGQAESLNAAVAAGILISDMRRSFH